MVGPTKFSINARHRSIISSLLGQLPTLFANVKNPEPALLPSLNAALAALDKTGGKVICSLAALPTYGPGRLFMRDDGKVNSAENDKKLLSTEHPGWRKVAEKMVAAGIGIDFFLAAPGGGYLDVATIGMIIFDIVLAKLIISRSCVIIFGW